MPYTDQTEYPRGVFQGNMATTPQTVSAGPIKVSSIVWANGAAASSVEVEVRDLADNILFDLYVPINSTVELGPFEAPSLKVLASGGPEANVDVSVFYFT